MENYEILTTWPKGAYGFVHIVKNLTDNKTYAMKKIECMDEATGNKAVREAMALLDLQHSSICKYKEVFVTWDKEVSALCVCMVMEYSKVGDVALVLRHKRRRREKVREMVIKNFVGQMVDVLVYINSKNVIHGNLKPSNILLLVDLSFAICDFTVPTFVNDEINFKIRMKDYFKIWMAPEAMEGKVTATSDIWSTACIMLEMMVCSKMDENEFDQLVKRIRTDKGHLQTILEKLHVEQKYTFNLCDLVQSMMVTDPQDRITTETLVDLEYVKESLVICGSPLSGMKKSPLGPLVVPYGEGIEKLLEYMQAEVEVEVVQKSALKYLFYLLYETEVLLASARIIPVLISVLKCHPNCLLVQAQVCRILLKFANKATEDSVEEGFLFSDRVVNVILSVMESRRKCMELQIIICNLLMMLSGSESAGKLIGKAGGIQSILKTLRMYRDNSHVCIPCCGALCSLVVNQHNARIAVSEGSLETVRQVLEKHLGNGDVVESSCSALWALSLEEKLTDEQFEQITLLLIEALKLHLRKETIVSNICLALSSLIRMSELVAFRILVPDNDRDGLALIVKTYRIHHTDPKVVQSICMVFLKMVQYGDVVFDLISRKVDTTLNEIKIKFASNEDIVTLVNYTLSKLQRAEAETRSEGGYESTDYT